MFSGLAMARTSVSNVTVHFIDLRLYYHAKLGENICTLSNFCEIGHELCCGRLVTLFSDKIYHIYY